jgi:hypothetical protein
VACGYCHATFKRRSGDKLAVSLSTQIPSSPRAKFDRTIHDNVSPLVSAFDKLAVEFQRFIPLIFAMPRKTKHRLG